ncbi:DUF433 domain-containing protein [Acidobacteria bacterium AH-259-O06]|nr:DUF433 domain-containing protein [Acidobacteria bacterium AH-259-O06]
MAELGKLDTPLYGITEAARYIDMPVSTLHYWVRGERNSRPVIKLPDEAPMLSFMNLVEVYMLYGIRRQYKIPLPAVRKTINYLSRSFGSKHPLAEESLQTDGIDLFIERAGQLINLVQSGQLAMRAILETHLRRIEYERHGVAIRLYPFTRIHGSDDPKIIVIDPTISFGKPIVKGTGILTSILAERYKAGEEILDLVEDYGLKQGQVEEAIRYEITPLAA